MCFVISDARPKLWTLSKLQNSKSKGPRLGCQEQNSETKPIHNPNVDFGVWILSAQTRNQAVALLGNLVRGVRFQPESTYIFGPTFQPHMDTGGIRRPCFHFWESSNTKLDTSTDVKWVFHLQQIWCFPDFGSFTLESKWIVAIWDNFCWVNKLSAIAPLFAKSKG